MRVPFRPAKLLWRGILSGLACAVIAWLLGQLPLARGMEDWMLDARFTQRGNRPTSAKVILIGLDEPSLDELHKPLAYLSPELAEVVSFATTAGAAAIGLDLIVPESLADLPELAAGGAGDSETLGLAVQHSGKVVLAQWKPAGAWLRPLPQWRLKAFANPEETDLGFVDLSPDPDSFLRRQQLYVRDGEQSAMSFALALVVRATNAEVRWTGNQLNLGAAGVPLDADQQMRINFAGPPGRFQEVPFRDVLRSARGESRSNVDFAGSVVIVGATGAGQQDWHATPFANNYGQIWYSPERRLMSGAEVHANIAATLLDRAFIIPQRWAGGLPMLLLIGAGFGALLEQMHRVRGAYRFLFWSLLAAVAFHAAWKLLCFEAFRLAHWQLPAVPVLLLGWLVYGSSFLVRWLRLRGIMQVITPAAVAEHLEARPESLGLSGEERVVTVLFADIRGFTTYSEGHSPREVVALLNAYFKEIVPIIERRRGVLNQFMGDGIMVIFGVSGEDEGHAADAVRAAVDMVQSVHALRETWAGFDFRGMEIGVGVHTGPAIVGTVGSPRRLDYTAIGDVVNTASRIESETKTQRTAILISDVTFRSLSSTDRRTFACTPIADRVHVKGKSESLMLHRVDPGHASPPSSTPDSAGSPG